MFDGGNRVKVERNRRGCIWMSLIFSVFVIGCSQIVLAPLVLSAAASGSGSIASLLGTMASNPAAVETAQVDVQQAIVAVEPLVRLFLLFFTGVATIVFGVIGFVIFSMFWPRQNADS